MNIQENEVDGIRVSHFPTLYFYSKHWRDPLVYEGDMSYDYLRKYL